jgi:hypothetical protein
MNSKIPIEELLRWRLARAEAEAPPAPRAAQLLERARPWWEIWPEQFRSSVKRLSQVQVAYGHAMADPRQPRTAHLVPTLIVRTGEEFQGFARVLYFSICSGRLRLRFQIDPAQGQSDPAFEATFIAAATAIPLFSARATLSVENEYRLDAELPEKIVVKWEQMKVTDRMPFRLILRTDTNG